MLLKKKKPNKQAWIYLQSIFRIQPLPASPPWCKPSQSFSWNTAVRSWHFYFQSSNLGDSFNYKPVCIILLLKTIHEMGLHFPQKKQHKSHPNPKMCKPVAHAYPTSSLNFMHWLMELCWPPCHFNTPHSYLQVFDLGIPSAWNFFLSAISQTSFFTTSSNTTFPRYKLL